MRNLARGGAMKAAIIAAATALMLAVSGVESFAAQSSPTVTVEDRPGAPREMLQELERATGLRLSEVDKVLALDAGKARLTVADIDKLVAGGEVDGVKVLGVMQGSQELLETSMADLSDGVYDGRTGTPDASSPAVIFVAHTELGWVCTTFCTLPWVPIWECTFVYE